MPNDSFPTTLALSNYRAALAKDNTRGRAKDKLTHATSRQPILCLCRLKHEKTHDMRGKSRFQMPIKKQDMFSLYGAVKQLRS